MPWWSWIVIWVALVALALVYVFLLGLKVWRDAHKTMRAFDDAGRQLREHQSAVEEKLRSSQPEPALRAKPGSAVFASPEQMKDDYLIAKDARKFRRLQRRVARRTQRGQLQSLRDIKTLKDVG